ncbi:carboxypeptidase-like regulatory domain-containing protein [Dehalococcoidia bacterium]|nr:carboxypeptidase-like regulatory domain-containing protein [Dehalococcoidia bacterium]MCL0095805.1 carboxypeptidase-like regulatory domain-containing protein [Dehalococcoidia bacterium]
MTRKIGILLVMLSLITLAIILVPSCIPRPHRYKYFVPVAAIDLGVSDYVDLMSVGPQEWAIADLRATVNGYEATIRNYTVPNEPIRPGDHVRLNVDDAFRADDRVHVEILHVPTGDILLNTIVKNVAPWAPPPPLPVEDPAPPAARGCIAGFVTDTAGVPIKLAVSPTRPVRDAEIRGVSIAERANVSARKQDRGIGWATITDEAGYFKMEVDVAVYDMRIWALGFSCEEVSGIVVTEGETTTVNFTLERAPAG